MSKTTIEIAGTKIAAEISGENVTLTVDGVWVGHGKLRAGRIEDCDALSDDTAAKLEQAIREEGAAA